ncbi:membrane-associated protein containing RNA-binding TRAM domain and ribonuclease PIN-domain, YacL B.subtilis ortholog [Microcystis sp. 0824]|nr:membrane-associated protein containing RNA-binding TRAM domain and ribonuclease PIN-domain, YacL B.subtilis ortholog [Microcystis sp. 0824]
MGIKVVVVIVVNLVVGCWLLSVGCGVWGVGCGVWGVGCGENK